MELGGLEEAGEVVTVDNGSLILSPVRPKHIPPDRFETALIRAMTERREVLQRLAE